MKQMIERNLCRVCMGSNLVKVLSLGETPLANSFFKQEGAAQEEQFFPLELNFCNSCSFVQLSTVVSPEILFRDYVYVSSTSPIFVAHFEKLAIDLIRRFNFAPGSLVVDIGSNDGILLKPFKESGMRVLGIDPATKIAAETTAQGIETKPVFFTPDTARNIICDYSSANLVTATSVFSHVDDLDSFIEGIKILLSINGVFVIEVYYLLDLIQKNLFDTVYHEHLSYFTVSTLVHLFTRCGLEIFDVEHTNTHGGSLRVFIQTSNGRRPKKIDTINTFVKAEAENGLGSPNIYHVFSERIEKNKKELKNLLLKLKSQGKKIVGYGAPAKGNTLLNYFGIGTDILDYIIDDSPWKHGLLTPGTHIPVVSSQKLKEQPPDYILILAWNFAPIIMNRFPDQRFIIPVPQPTVVDSLVDQDLFNIAESLGSEVCLLEGKTILITGGSGFLGSYFVATLDFLNHYYFKIPCRVISIDNHLIGKKNNLLKEIESLAINYLVYDVRNPLFIEEKNIDYIINAAGVASPVYYKQYPIETIEGTIFGLKNTLELARQKQVKGVLYFSSSEIYGDPDPNFIPTPETYKGNVSSIGPRSCYDESKRVGETLAIAFHQVHGVPVKIVRPFNVYGPGMSSKDYRVVPTFLNQGLKGEALTVHDMGNQTRTFCYATDAIVGFFKVLLNGRNGEVYNIGNESNEINMLGLAELVARSVFNNQVEVKLVCYPHSYPQDEPRRRCPDLSKARRELNYEPLVDLASGLYRSFLWFKNTTPS